MRAYLSLIVAAVMLVGTNLHADEWPQWRGPQRDGVWRETGIVERLPDEVEPRWSVEVGAGYSSPTVADGRVYVTDRVDEPQEIERVHCFDFKTGERLWSHEYPTGKLYGGIGYKAGPRAAVIVQDGRAYSLGGVGHLHCFDARTGKVLWQHDLYSEYDIDMPRWGIASSPLIEGEVLIVQIGGKDACLVAFNRETGKEAWRALSDAASYTAPIVIDQAGRRVLVCYTADRVVGMDPQTGKLLWHYDMPGSKWPIAIATPVVHDDLLLVSSAHVGSALLRLDPDHMAVHEVWRRDGSKSREQGTLHSLITTPLIQGKHIYGLHQNAKLRCLDLMTGELVWESEAVMPVEKFGTLHMVEHGPTGRTFIFNELGELIIAQLSPKGYHEIDRANIIGPTKPQNPGRRTGVTWAHPAFANRHILVRSDEQLVSVDLSE